MKLLELSCGPKYSFSPRCGLTTLIFNIVTLYLLIKHLPADTNCRVHTDFLVARQYEVRELSGNCKRQYWSLLRLRWLIDGLSDGYDV